MQETRIFNADVGQNSTGNAGPDAIEQDLDNLYENKAWKDEVLTKSNTESYIPSQDYHPVTKKFLETYFADNNMSKPIYDSNNNGIVDNAEKVNGHTVETDVPANAVFTAYEHPANHSADIIVDGITNKVYTNIEKLKLADIESGATADQNASEVPIADVGELFASTNVETALQEIASRVGTIIATPAESVSAQEIIDARQGAASLGLNITIIKERIKDLAINIKSYGAIGDGVTDDTTAFVNAINALPNGGKILVPYGNYVISSQLILTEGIKLIGLNASLYITNITDDAIILSRHTEINGFTFFYPNQINVGAGSPVVYPPTLSLMNGSSSDIKVMNCFFVNAYQIAKFTENHGRITIENVIGFPLFIGIEIDNSLDIDRIINVHFNPTLWADAFAPTDFSQYSRNNASAFLIKRADWIIIENCFAWGYKNGVYIANGPNGSIAAGQIINCGFDMCKTGVFCDTANAWGVDIIGCSFVAQNPVDTTEVCTGIKFTAVGYGISIKDNKFWSCTGSAIILSSLSGVPKNVNISNNTVLSYGSAATTNGYRSSIELQNISRLVLKGNLTDGKSRNYVRGITLASCHNFIIAENIIQNITSQGILIRENGGMPITNNFIIKNNIFSSVTTAFLDQSTGTTKFISDNIV